MLLTTSVEIEVAGAAAQSLKAKRVAEKHVLPAWLLRILRSEDDALVLWSKSEISTAIERESVAKI